MIGLAQLLVDQRGEAEDIVQESFARLYASFRRIDDPDRSTAYLRSIVLNLARSRLRRRRTARSAAALIGAEARTLDPHEQLSRLDRDSVTAAIRALPRRQADCTVLRYYLDCSDKEIAATLGISTGSVKQHLSRARRRLADELGELA